MERAGFYYRPFFADAGCPLAGGRGTNTQRGNYVTVVSDFMARNFSFSTSQKFRGNLFRLFRGLFLRLTNACPWRNSAPTTPLHLLLDNVSFNVYMRRLLAASSNLDGSSGGWGERSLFHVFDTQADIGSEVNK